MTDRVVLFVCVENAARSLMAESIFNAHPPLGWRAESAGTEPAHAPNPRTSRMLKEIGLELPPHPPRLLTREMAQRATLSITMGCLDNASCPAFLLKGMTEDWALPDPGELDDTGFRQVRERIGDRIRKLTSRLETRGNVPTASVGAPRNG